MTPRISTLVFVAAILSGCDPAGLGYVNRLSHPVTIVEDGSKRPAQTIRLTAGEIRQPTIGIVPHSIDLLDSRGQLIAHYRIRDIPREHPRGDDYVVITPQGAVFRFSPSGNR